MLRQSDCENNTLWKSSRECKLASVLHAASESLPVNNQQSWTPSNPKAVAKYVVDYKRLVIIDQLTMES